MNEIENKELIAHDKSTGIYYNSSYNERITNE